MIGLVAASATPITGEAPATAGEVVSEVPQMGSLNAVRFF